MSIFGSSSQPPVTARAAAFFSRPVHAGEEADAELRAHVVRVAGTPSLTPLSETLSGLITSWFSPISLGDDGAIRGTYDGAAVRVTAAEVRDVLPGVTGQLGFEVTGPVLADALALVARRARAARERDAVALEHQRAREQERERVKRVEDAEAAERRAALLRELAALDDAPKAVATTTPIPAARPVPGPPPRRWRRG